MSSWSWPLHRSLSGWLRKVDRGVGTAVPCPGMLKCDRTAHGVLPGGGWRSGAVESGIQDPRSEFFLNLRHAGPVSQYLCM